MQNWKAFSLFRITASWSCMECKLRFRWGKLSPKQLQNATGGEGERKEDSCREEGQLQGGRRKIVIIMWNSLVKCQESSAPCSLKYFPLLPAPWSFWPHAPCSLKVFTPFSPLPKTPLQSLYFTLKYTFIAFTYSSSSSRPKTTCHT